MTPVRSMVDLRILAFLRCTDGVSPSANRTHSALVWLCCVAMATCPPGLIAQAGHGSPRAARPAADSATIEGVALDSLHEIPWSGATVVIRDLTTAHVDTVSADEDGHFRTLAVGAHRYQLSATDSLADVLGLRITANLIAASDSTTRVVLALPGAISLIHLVCGSAWSDAGAVAGRVTMPDRGADLRAATITVDWVATQIDVAEHRVTPVSQVATSVADQDGRFVVCGLPVPLRATLVARLGNDSTTQPVTLTGKQQFTAAALTLPTRADVAGFGRAMQSVAGTNSPQPSVLSAPVVLTVLTTSGKPIEQAQVTLDNGARSLTDSAGVVRLWPGGARTHRLLVRKLGFAPLDVTTTLNAEHQLLTVHLHPTSTVLPTVAVTAERDRAHAEFELRARTGIGDYFTEADIERLKPECLLDLLRRLPGLRVNERSGCAGGVSALRGQGTIFGDAAANGCVRLMVDGGPSGGYDSIDVDDILGVEFYDETTAPVRYGTQCAVVAVWTKEARRIF